MLAATGKAMVLSRPAAPADRASSQLFDNIVFDLADARVLRHEHDSALEVDDIKVCPDVAIRDVQR